MEQVFHDEAKAVEGAEGLVLPNFFSPQAQYCDAVLSIGEEYSMLPRITFFFESGKFGWTETVYAVANDLTSTMALALTLFPKRRDLGASDVNLVAVRVSDDDVRGDSLFHSVPFGQQRNLAGGPKEVNQHPDGVEIRLTATPLARRIFILRGIEDAIQNAGILIPNGAWNVNFPLWRAAMTSGQFGLKAKADNPAGSFVLSMTNDFVLGRITIDTVDPIPLFFTGDLVYLGGGRNAPGLRGFWRITKVGASRFYINSRAVVSNITGVWYTRKATYQVRAITAVDVGRLGTRRTGRPSLGPRGRRSALPRR